MGDRRGHRWWNGAGALAAVVVLGAVTGCTGTTLSAPSGAAGPPHRPPTLGASARPPSSGVAWIDAPVSTPDPARWAASLPPCRAAALVAHIYPSGGTAGSVVYRVEIVNGSPGVCVLRGRPVTLTGLTPAGARLALDPQWMASGVPYVTDEPAILPAGGAADLALITGVTCDGGVLTGPSYSSLVIGLADGDVVASSVDDGDQPLQFTCGVSATPFARWAEGEGDGAPFSGVASLTVALSPSFSVQRGEPWLDVSVTLVNAGSRAIALRPCPSYTETLTIETEDGDRPGPDDVRVASYRLNCSAAPVVPAESSLAFAMRMPLPRTFPPAAGATLQWRLNVLDGTGPEGSSTWCADC